MDINLYKYLGLCFLFGAILFFCLQFSPDPHKKEIKRSAGLTLHEFHNDKSKLVRWFYPIIALLLPLISNLPVAGYRKKLQQWLTTAAMDQEVTPDHVLCLHCILPILFILMAKGISLSPFAILMAALLGFAFPVIWIYQKKKDRQNKILRAMPSIVDMLSLTIEAGLSFQAAVERICELDNNTEDAFVEELQVLRQNIRIGMSRAEALQTMAMRVDNHDIKAFCAILIQAEKMGSSISMTLKEQAIKMRGERFMKAERQGAMASQVILIPLVLFILPILFVIVLGPFILKYIYSY